MVGPERRPGHGFLCSTRSGCGRWLASHLFLGAPALCWWARTMVLSIIAYSLSASAARCSNTRCHTPVLLQRLNRRCVFFQSPKRSGRSRHGMGTISVQHRLDKPAIVVRGYVDELDFGGVGFCGRDTGSDRPSVVPSSDAAQDLSYDLSWTGHEDHLGQFCRVELRPLRRSEIIASEPAVVVVGAVGMWATRQRCPSAASHVTSIAVSPSAR